MKNSKALFLCLPLAFCTIALHAVHANAIPVVNGTFDISDPSSSTPLDLGSNPGANIYSNGLGTDQTINYSNGAAGPASASILGFSGSGDVQALGSQYVTPGAGSSGLAATVDASGNISEILTSTLQADSVYTLSFVAARRLDQFDPSAFFSANLYAVPSTGAPILLASTTTDPTPLQLNTQFTAYTLTYDDTAALAAPVGDTLEIAFTNTAVGGSEQVLVDNVSLDRENTTSSTPEPSTFALLFAGCGALLLVASLRRRKV